MKMVTGLITIKDITNKGEFLDHTPLSPAPNAPECFMAGDRVRLKIENDNTVYEIIDYLPPDDRLYPRSWMTLDFANDRPDLLELILRPSA
jgi:hypothetical protein